MKPAIYSSNAFIKVNINIKSIGVFSFDIKHIQL